MTDPKPTVLVVDDEENISALVRMALEAAGLEVAVANSSATAITAVEDTNPDMMVLDVMLGDVDGFTTLSTLRERGIQIPVLFLTALDATADKVAGLSLGDDYLTKPFSVEELVARVRALLRRVTPGESHRLICGDLTLDEDNFEVTRSGEVIQLTPTEYRLLRILMRNADKVVTRAQILDAVWEYDFSNRANVDTYISYLRKKIDTEGQDSLIVTQRGFGYMIKSHP